MNQASAMFKSIDFSLKGIPAQHLVEEPLSQKEYLINGKIKQWKGPVETVLSPMHFSENKTFRPLTIGYYPLLGEKESLEALKAATDAYNQGKGLWPTMSVENRIVRIERFAVAMKAQRTEVVKLMMWEIGKSLEDSEKEFDRTLTYITDTIEAMKDLDRVSSRFVMEKGILALIRRAPLGVVLCMGPYNYPLNETFTTLIPALIMGNTVIFKPPRLGVLLHKPLLTAFRDHFPPGVVNTVYGDGKEVISPLMKSGKIDALAFIGSCKVADILKQQHPMPHRLRSILGLEAKNAAIVLQDADIELSVKECVTGSLSFNGQRCTALKILFVHEKILRQFMNALINNIHSLSMDMPWHNPVLTPLAESGKAAYLKDLIDDAVSKGAEVMNQRGGKAKAGFFIPAVVYPVKQGMRLYNEEQFGPVIPIASYRNIREPLEYISSSNFGQQVSIFGKDPEALASLIDPLANQVCRININAQCLRGPDTFPFTGRKDSAEGTLSVSDALRVFSIRSLVAARRTPENDAIIRDIIDNKRSNFLSTDFIL